MGIQKFKNYFLKHKEKIIKYSMIFGSILISGVIIYFRNELAKLQGLWSTWNIFN